MKVDFPHPDSPTQAQEVPAGIFMFIPLNTHSDFLVGYLNQTSLNSMSPTKESLLIETASSLIYNGFIILFRIVLCKISTSDSVVAIKLLWIIKSESLILSASGN